MAAAVAAAIAVLHCGSYFFLFDDFALIHEASTKSPTQILTSPLFEFYRPAAFLLAKLEFAFAGWEWPVIYSITNIAIHVTNAGLVYVLALLLSTGMNGLRSSAPLLAAVVFLLSPWALEAPFWLCGRFDVLATTGILAAVCCGSIVIRSDRRTIRLVAASAGFAAYAIGVFSKEMAATGPMLFLLTVPLVQTSGTGPARWRWALVYACGLSATVALYLAVRQGVIANLGGTYGALPDLLRNAHIAQNVVKFTAGLVRFAAAAPSGVQIVAPVLLALVSIWSIIRLGPRTVIVLLSTFVVSLSPVLWAGLASSGSGGGRFLYLPGVWFSLTLGYGLSARSRMPNVDAVSAVAAAVALLLMTSSVAWQSVVWRQAAALSRGGISQLTPYAGTQQPLFIPNLPFWYNEGAYVLKASAFEYYGYPEKMPPVTVRPYALKVVDGRPHFAVWADEYGAARPSPGDVVVALELPVVGLLLPPSPPVGLTAEVSARSVLLTWKATAGPTPDRIVIEAGTKPSFSEVVATYNLPGSALTHTVHGAAPGTYYVRIRAENSSGASINSPELEVVVP